MEYCDYGDGKVVDPGTLERFDRGRAIEGGFEIHEDLFRLKKWWLLFHHFHASRSVHMIPGGR